MALNFIKKAQGIILDDHALHFELSKQEESQQSLKKREEKLKVKESGRQADLDNESIQSNKLLIKNLAFQATPKDLKELFKGYGAIKRIRIPKKVGSKDET